MVTCEKCGREVGSSYSQCVRCGGAFCSDHRRPEVHGCMPAAGPRAGDEEPAIRIERDQEWYNPKEPSRKSSSRAGAGKTGDGDDPGDLFEVGAILLGIVLVAAGLYLFVGNVSGTHATFPYAGFITMTLGAIFLAAGFGNKK
jgi:hypothetical protein